MIICFSGLAGSGKTTAANLLIQKLQKLNYDVVHLTTDYIREYLYIGEYDLNDDFSAEQLKRSYRGLYMLITELLRKNPDIIIVTDGMYRKMSQRLMLSIVAEICNVPYTLVKVETNVTLAKNRLTERYKDGNIGGWVDPKEYQEPIKGTFHTIRNNQDFSYLEAQVKKLIVKIHLNKYYIGCRL